jgi:hypothetical protein
MRKIWAQGAPRARIESDFFDKRTRKGLFRSPCGLAECVRDHGVLRAWNAPGNQKREPGFPARVGRISEDGCIMQNQRHAVKTNDVPSGRRAFVAICGYAANEQPLLKEKMICLS